MVSIATHPTFNDVLVLARQLRPADQARLVARLSAGFVAALDVPAAIAPEMADPRALLAEVRETFLAQGPVSPTMAEDLATSRR